MTKIDAMLQTSGSDLDTHPIHLRWRALKPHFLGVNAKFFSYSVRKIWSYRIGKKDLLNGSWAL